jgi:hypothetical protein
VVVSFAAAEARDALLGVKTAKAGTMAVAVVAVPSASSFVLLENEEQFIHHASPTTFFFLICNQIFVTCISPS